jgi:hypothetical protein
MGNTIADSPGSVDDSGEHRLTSSSCMSSGIEALKEIDGRHMSNTSTHVCVQHAVLSCTVLYGWFFWGGVHEKL